MEGVQRLKAGHALKPGDPGFSQIVETFHERARRDNPDEVLSQISVIKIERDANWRMMSASRVIADDTRVVVHMSNGQKAEITFKGLSDKLEGFRAQPLFAISIAVFIVGLALMLVAFVLDYREPKTSNKRMDSLELI